MGKIMKARIAYTGPLLDHGEMDVKELAPALIAFADLVENVNTIIGGEQPIKVLVNQDSIQRGSFDVTLLLMVDSILEQAKLFMGVADESGLSALVEILGFAGSSCASIFTLIKWINGRQIKSIEDKSPNIAEITLDDDKRIQTNKKTMKVFLDLKCRVNIERVISPLLIDGIDGFELRDPENKTDKAPLETIKKSEVGIFKSPPAQKMEDVESKGATQRLIVQIIAPNFEGGKWRLSDGNNPFWATIEDEDFLRKINTHSLVFGKGDVLIVNCHMQQFIKNGKLSSEWFIEKVLDIKLQKEQIQLPFEYN